MNSRYTAMLVALVVLFLAGAPGRAQGPQQLDIQGNVTSAEQYLLVVQGPGGPMQVVLNNSTQVVGPFPVAGNWVRVVGWRVTDGRMAASRVEVNGSGWNPSGGGGGGGGPIVGEINMMPAAGSVVTVTRPDIGASFSVPVQAQSLIVDGRQVPAQSSGNRVWWTPSYDLDQGRHNVHLTVVEANTGRRLDRSWTFTIQGGGGGYNPGGGGLGLTNLANGQSVPPNFNVQGSATPNARVVITGNYDRALIPGVISLPGGAIRNEGDVNGNGHFDVPISLGNLPNGTRVNLTATALDGNGRQLGSGSVWVRVSR